MEVVRPGGSWVGFGRVELDISRPGCVLKELCSLDLIVEHHCFNIRSHCRSTDMIVIFISLPSQ